MVRRARRPGGAERGVRGERDALACGQYSVNWSISAATTGTNSVYADATGNAGAVKSLPYNITINP